MFSQGTQEKKKVVAVWLSLVTITFLVFAPVLQCGFTDWDDDAVLTQNDTIKALNAENLQTIFTTINLKTYIPLTVFSFALEYAVFKDNPLVYHLDNLLLHLAVVSLVFFLGMELGLSLEAAGLAALLFGVHPMRVESVAWITERKDVLYAFFYLSAVLCYARYLRAKKFFTYFLTILFGLLSILSKPMALSLPLILFLVDWMKKEKMTVKLFLNKLPHFLFIVPIAWITYSVNARVPVFHFPEALWVWIWSFTFYIRKFLFPLTLKPLYPFSYPVTLANAVYLQAVFAFAAMVVVFYCLRRNKWFVFGWLYFIFSIFFLLRFDYRMDLGIVADRFMYLPSLGFCFFFGNGMVFLFQKYRERKGVTKILVMVIVGVMALLSLKTFTQISVWKDKASLWEYLIDVFPDKDVAYNNMGVAFMERGDYQRALEYYNLSIQINPVRAKVYVTRGNLYARRGEYQKAISDYSIAKRLDPQLKETYLNMAYAMSALRKYNLAIVNFTQAINLDDTYLVAYIHRGNHLMIKKDYPLALRDFNRALALDPKLGQVYIQRGLCHRLMNNDELALADFSKALRLNPKDVGALMARGNLYVKQKKYKRAFADMDLAIKLNPKNSFLYSDRAMIYAMTGQTALAFKDYEQALALDPRNTEAQQAQALLYKVLKK